MFDREFLDEQTAEHRVAIALFAFEAERGQDPDLRSFAARYLPVLQRHLDQLSALAVPPVANLDLVMPTQT